MQKQLFSASASALSEFSTRCFLKSGNYQFSLDHKGGLLDLLDNVGHRMAFSITAIAFLVAVTSFLGNFGDFLGDFQESFLVMITILLVTTMVS